MSPQALTLNFSDALFSTEYEAGNTETIDQSSPFTLLPSDARSDQVSQYNDPDSSASFIPSSIHNNTLTMRAPPFQISFVAEQEWEGYVTEVNGEEFKAHLIDLSETDIEETAEFSINEVSSIHKELVKEGAIFRWSIGYERIRGGTKRKVSSIIFRRLPAWTKRDLSKSISEVESFQNNIIWE